MDHLFTQLATVFGASGDQLKLIFCLLLSYPLGSLFVRIPRSRPSLRHLFNIFVSALYLIGIFNLYWGFAQLLASTITTYFVAKYHNGPNMPWIVFSFVMSHLLVNHIYRTYWEINLDQFEITGTQMVLTLKLTTFAWNIWDGRQPKESLDKAQVAGRITEFPSLLSFLGHMFYFPALLVGHSSDYVTYMALVDGSLFSVAAERGDLRHVPRGRKRVAYAKAASGLVFLGLHVVGGPKFDYEIVLHSWWPEKSFLYRLVYFQIIGFFARTKYYAAWLLAEGACILTGLGFSGYNSAGETLWEGASNIRITTIEAAPNFKVLLDSWNMKTNVWLRECVYKRVTPKGKKPGFRSSMGTFITSAIWHGVYSGYYLTFLLAGFITTAARLARSYIRPLFLPPLEPPKNLPAKIPPPPTTLPKQIYDIVGTCCTMMILNYCTAPFVLLHWDRSLEAYRKMHWYGHWMVGVSLAFFFLGGKGILRKARDSRVKKAQAEETSRKQHVTGDHVDSPEFAVGAGQYSIPPVDSFVQAAEEAIMQNGFEDGTKVSGKDL